MNKWYRLLTFVLLAGWCISPVFAEGNGDHEAVDRFAKLDTNGDGSISLDEFKVVQEKRLEKMKEKLGDKFDPEKVPNTEKAFARIDTDHSGSISREELAAGRDKVKKQTDQNPE